MTGKTATLHSVAFICTLIVYCILTLFGHDANPVLGVLGGQGIGAIVQSSGNATANDVPQTQRIPSE